MKQSLLQRVVRRAAVLTAGLGLATLAHAQSYTGLFVFGDSLSDNGNDLLVTGGLLPSPTYYTNGTDTGRFTNGLSYADYLAAGLGLGLTPSVAGGNNYAFGGARRDSVALGLPTTALSFNQQISAFAADHAVADAGALYVLWIGANDMSDAFASVAMTHSLAPIGTAINGTMQSIGAAIQTLASSGATHFLVPNLPNLSLIPALTSLNDPNVVALAESASLSFNIALKNTLASPAFSGLDIRLFDVYGAHTAISADPSAFGFTNTADACYTGGVSGLALPGGPAPSVCSTPDTYLYWDYEHPSQALNAVLGAQALAVAVPEPSSWLMLTLGLVVFAVVRRSRGAGDVAWHSRPVR